MKKVISLGFLKSAVAIVALLAGIGMAAGVFLPSAEAVSAPSMVGVVPLVSPTPIYRLPPAYPINTAVQATVVAKVNGETVDEVCAGQTVTVTYTITNYHIAGDPHIPAGYGTATYGIVTIVEDGVARAGTDIAPGQTVTFSKDVQIGTGQTNFTLYVIGTFAPTLASDDTAEASASWSVNGGECNVNVVKRVDGAPPSGSQSFTFEVRTGASTTNVGTTIASAVANAANGGSFAIAPSLTLGSQYQFCETNVLPGWTTSLSLVAGAFTPGSANQTFDNGVVCVGFSATGDNIVFEVNNQRPIAYGPARTIGYWKNWSSCSGGKQSPVLDYVLSTFGTSAPAVPTLPLPNPLPAINPGASLGGSAQINTCSKATSILDKSTFGGVKKASDPAYNMAAQLLAVKLNIQAGADPRCIGPYVTEADGILTAIGFTGTSIATPPTSTQAARMGVLAGYFDRYNNGAADLCPLP